MAAGIDSADLVIVCPHLGAGGTQRVITTLANAWTGRGRKIAVVTLYEKEAVYTLDPAIASVCIHSLMVAGRGNRKGPFNRLRRWMNHRLRGTRLDHLLKRIIGYVLDRAFHYGGHYYYAYCLIKDLRRVLRKNSVPVVLAFIGKTNMITILACRKLGKKVVISERNDPARQVLQPPWNRLRPLLYKKADLVTANSRHALDTMARYVSREKLAFVPNPLLRPAQQNGRLAGTVQEAPFILTVGRLHPQKAYDVLLRAFHLLPAPLAAWRLVMVGDGELRDDLEQLAVTLGIADRVTWTGHVDDPAVYYHEAGIFALPSRHEGTSNALLEAMSYGVPAIVTDACPGSVELVEDGIEGLVIPVDDPGALAAALTRLAEDDGLRRRLGEAARRRVEAFALPVVLEHWDEVLQS